MAIKHINYEGYEFDVEMDCFDDVEFFEIADKLESDPKLHIDILKIALGEDGYQKFANFFKKAEGKLKMSKVIGAVSRIFEQADPKGSASGSSEKTTQKN